MNLSLSFQLFGLLCRWLSLNRDIFSRIIQPFYKFLQNIFILFQTKFLKKLLFKFCVAFSQISDVSSFMLILKKKYKVALEFKIFKKNRINSFIWFFIEICRDSAADEDVLRRIIGSRDDAADGPLDMSTGRRLPAERSPPPPYHRSSGSDSAGYHTSPYSMYPSPPEYSSAGRPSVITCASSLRSSPAPSCPSPCSSTGSVSSSARPASPSFQSTAPSVSSVRNQRHNDDGRPPHRREVISSGRHLFASAQTRKSFLLVNLLPRNGEKPGRLLPGIKKRKSSIGLWCLGTDICAPFVLSSTLLCLVLGCCCWFPAPIPSQSVVGGSKCRREPYLLAPRPHWRCLASSIHWPHVFLQGF